MDDLEYCVLNLTVSALLNKLEDALRDEGFWQESAPLMVALSSVEPFCVDTLSCTEWLQWVYIPRLRAIIEERGVLPTGAHVHPYAEEALTGLAVARILSTLAELDIALSR